MIMAMHTATVSISGVILFGLLMAFLGTVFGFMLGSIGANQNGDKSDTTKENTNRNS